MSNQTLEVSYHNDVFFKYALSRDDEDSIFIRHSIIEAITGIKPKESIVLNPELNANIFYKKNIILDVHIKDDVGREYDIEMQVAGKKISEMKRFEYYGGQLISGQLYQGDSYEELKPVYQIIFLNAYGRNKSNLIAYYQMRDQDGIEESEDAILH